MDWKSAIATFGNAGRMLILGGRRLVMPNKTPFKFAVVSDLHVDNLSQGSQNDFNNALTKIVMNGAERVFCCGDIVTNASSSNFQYFTSTLAQHPGVKFASCKGNHDYSLDGQVWCDGVKCDSPNYTVEAGGCLFVMMSIDTSSNNVSRPYSSDTLQWLQNILTRNKGRRIILFMHYPINPNDSTVQYAGLRKGGSSYQYGYAYGSSYSTQLLNMLKSHGNIIAFSGHSHYEFGVNDYYSGIVDYRWTNGTDQVNLIHVPSLASPRDKDHQTIHSGQPDQQPSQCYIVEVYDDHMSVKGMELNLTQSPSGEFLKDYAYDIPIEDASIPTAADYVSSDLLAMWDGIENAGFGVHDSSATTWKNLASQNGTHDMSRTMVSWNSDSANFVRQNVNNGTFDNNVFNTASTSLIPALGSEWTLEVILCPDAGYFNNYSGVFGQYFSQGSKKGIFGLQYENGDLRSAVFSASGGVAYYFTSSTASRSINNMVQSGKAFSMAMSASQQQLIGRTFINGQRVYQFNIASNSCTLNFDSRFYLGAGFSAIDRLFSGKIFACRMYARALADSEVAANYQIDQVRFNLS